MHNLSMSTAHKLQGITHTGVHKLLRCIVGANFSTVVKVSCLSNLWCIGICKFVEWTDWNHEVGLLNFFRKGAP